MSKNLFKFAFVLLCFIASSVSVRAGEQFEEYQSFDEGCYDTDQWYGWAPDGWLYEAHANSQFTTCWTQYEWIPDCDGSFSLGAPSIYGKYPSSKAYTPGFAIKGGTTFTISFKYYTAGNGTTTVQGQKVDKVVTTYVRACTAQNSESVVATLGSVSNITTAWEEASFTFTPENDGIYYFLIEAEGNQIITSQHSGSAYYDAFVFEGEHPDPAPAGIVIDEYENFDGCYDTDQWYGWAPDGWLYEAHANSQFTTCWTQYEWIPDCDGSFSLGAPSIYGKYPSSKAYTPGFAIKGGTTFTISFKYYTAGNGTTTVQGQKVDKVVTTYVRACTAQNSESVVATLGSVSNITTAWEDASFTFTPESDGIYYFLIEAEGNQIITSQHSGSAYYDAFTFEGTGCEIVPAPDPISEYPAVESFEEDLRGWSFSNTERYFMVASAEDAGLQGAPDGDNVLVLPETSPAFGEPTAVTNGYVMEAGEIYEITFQYYAPGNNAPSVRYNTTTLSVGTDRDECNLALGNLTGVFDQWEEEAFWFSPEEDGVYYFEIKSVANVPACGMVAIDLFSVDKLVEETVYLAGQCNGWNPAAEGYKFARQDDGTYTLDVEGSVGEFKLTNGTWDVNYGSNGEALVAGEPYQLAQKGGNLTVNVTNPHFVLDVATWTLTVTGDVAEMEVPETLYLVGNIDGHNWDIANAVPFTREEGTNTFKLTKAPIVAAGDDTNYGYFSFITTCGSSWDEVNASDRFGATTPDAEVVAPATADVEWFQGGVNAGSAYAWKIAAGNYDITVDFDAMTVQIIASEEGAIDIEVINSDARYFNLQGVEVPAPSNGVFIEVLGTQVRKVYVK